MKATKHQAIVALNNIGRDMSMKTIRTVNEWSRAFKDIEVNPDLLGMVISQEHKELLNSMAVSAVDVKALVDLFTKWEPSCDCDGDDEYYSLIDSAQQVVNIVRDAGWNADHKDDVDEEVRRFNFRNRQRMESAAIAFIAIKYASVWVEHGSSCDAALINSMFECDLFNLSTFGLSSEMSALKLLESNVNIICLDPVRGGYNNLPKSTIAHAAHVAANSGGQFNGGISGGNEINEQPRATVEWLVDGVIPKTVDEDSPYIGFIYGNSATYKSFIATGICSAVVKGEVGVSGFAGLASVGDKAGKVLYLSGEDSYGVRVRFEAEFGGLVPQGVSMNTNELECLFDEDGEIVKDVALTVCRELPDLVVMDTMNSLKLCENNNSSAAVSKMMHKLKELGTTVMIVHHSTKGGDSMEGSHAMFSNADFVLRTDVVEREDDIPVVDLSCGKLKNAAKFKPMRIELVEQEDSLVCRNHKQYEEARGKRWKDMTNYEKVNHFLDSKGAGGASIDEIVIALGNDPEDGEDYKLAKKNMRKSIGDWMRKDGCLIFTTKASDGMDARRKNFTTCQTDKPSI